MNKADAVTTVPPNQGNIFVACNWPQILFEEQLNRFHGLPKFRMVLIPMVVANFFCGQYLPDSTIP
jgi:hypothetical protein